MSLLAGLGRVMLQSCEPVKLLQSVRNRRKYLDHHYVKWKIQKKVGTHGIDKRLSTESGHRIIMRKVLRDSKFIAWGHKSQVGDTRLNYPL